MKKYEVLAQLSIILCAVVLRLLPHPANFAPIAGMALFGGATLSKRYAFVVPLAAMILSDLFLGFHSTILFVYGSFLLIGVIGLLLRTHRQPPLLVLGSLLASVLFFLITNFGVWYMGTLYPKTLAGLLDAYAMGVPFFRNTILGDLFYTGVFFGSYAILRRIAFEKLSYAESA